MFFIRFNITTCKTSNVVFRFLLPRDPFWRPNRQYVPGWYNVTSRRRITIRYSDSCPGMSAPAAQGRSLFWIPDKERSRMFMSPLRRKASWSMILLNSTIWGARVLLCAPKFVPTSGWHQTTATIQTAKTAFWRINIILGRVLDFPMEFFEMCSPAGAVRVPITPDMFQKGLPETIPVFQDARWRHPWRMVSDGGWIPKLFPIPRLWRSKTNGYEFHRSRSTEIRVKNPDCSKTQILSNYN